MSKRLLSELQVNLNYLSAVERRIAGAILEDPRKFITFSMSDLAEYVSVSHGSIINFANKFAGGGFPKLKLQIAADLREYEQQPFSSVTNADGVQDVLDKTIRGTNQAFHHTLKLNSEATLRSVVSLILNARKVEIYGVFRSAVVATDFYYQLLQLGVPASFVSDVLTCAISASMLSDDSLVIAVSSSGKTKDVIDAVKAAKANGVPVVCITSNNTSPLAELSDHVLVSAPSGISVSGRATEIRLSQLLLTDAICAYIRSTIDADGKNSYFALQEILNSHNVND
jgi:DNA-binding MurR/RpiR family transcriptional regulator